MPVQTINTAFLPGNVVQTHQNTTPTSTSTPSLLKPRFGLSSYLQSVKTFGLSRAWEFRH